MRALRLLSAGAVALVLFTACDGPGIAGPDNPRIARAGTSNSPSASVVGTWRRTVFFLDEFNFAHSSETTFRFDANGTAVRAQVARNHTLGLVDALVSTGTWSLTGGQVVIDFVTPSVFRLTLAATVTGNELSLAGETYLRVLD
jgi:hypothetical protein